MQFAPEEINEDIIENACDDLQDALVDLLENKDNESYDRVVYEIKSISAMLDDMIVEDD